MSAKLRRNGRLVDVSGGLDFEQAVLDPELGQRCLMKEELLETVERVPKVLCSIRSESQCFTSYITKFRPHQQKTCDQKYVKTCQITFIPREINVTLQDCFRPLTRNCSHKPTSQASTESQFCVTEYHSVCSNIHLHDSGIFSGHLDKTFFFLSKFF